MRQLLHCYHVIEENPGGIHIMEVEGEKKVEGTKLESEYFSAPLNINKVNIGT
jgi:hypothetical protein